jgi:hypothetical protein
MSALATSTILAAQSSGLTTAAYLRIASISIAAYEYVASCVTLPFRRISFAFSFLLTLPAEYRLYKSSDRRR